MAAKLGEILVAGSYLSAADLKKALDAQLIFGGRLGTNLLELGFLDEATLSQVLREQKRVEVASLELLDGASREALQLVPAKVADRHKLIPLKLQDKKLTVAMVDPTDLIVIDELAFMTGCTILPLIAPEVRLLAFLERYYGIPRPLRYIKLAEAEQDGRTAGGSASSAAAAAGGAAPSAPAEESGPELSISDLLGVGPEESLTPEALQSVAAAPDKMDAAVAELKRRREEEVRRQAAEPPRSIGLPEASRLLAEADTREEIGEALVALGAGQFRRVLTFIVQKDRAMGWMASLPGVTPDEARRRVREVVLALDQPSVIQSVASSGQYYMGELPERPGDAALAAALGAPRPAGLVILPVTLNEKVIFALYGDAADQPLSGFDMRGLRSACQKASLAMEVLLLRSRIRQS